MKKLVVFDSKFGNTKKIAEAIAKGMDDDVKVLCVGDMEGSSLNDIDLLVVGAPTHGGQASQPLRDWLSQLEAGCLRGVKVAAFDTRANINSQPGWLRWLMNLIGYAAPKIEKTLVGLGGELAMQSEGFLVKDKEGPLVDGELDRARDWGDVLI